MKLGDVMSSMGLAIYAEVALVIFFVVFIAIVASVLAKKKRAQWEQASRLPLDDESPRPSTATQGDSKP